MNINEAIVKIESLKKYSTVVVTFSDSYVVRFRDVINIISQIDTQPKVVVPKYVDEIIKDLKAKGCKLLDVQSYTFEDKVQEWIDDHYEQFCIAFIFGYEVEKEKKYTVRMKNVCHKDLGYNVLHGVYSFYDREHNRSGIVYEFTKSKLEQAGLIGVLDNPMFEVEEVE